MSYKIDEIEGIGTVYAARLATAGIHNTDDLLKLCCDRSGRREVSRQTGLGEAQLLGWANMADLMRVSGIGSEYSELLEAAGVDTIKELRHRNAENLAAKMAEINAEKKLTRQVPGAATVTRWVEQAKELEPLITH